MMEKIPNVQSERQNYITPETRPLQKRNKQFYRDKVDASRKIPQRAAAQIPKIPPLPRDVEKKKKKLLKAKVIKSIPKRKRKRKKKDSKVSTLPKAQRPRKDA